MLRAKLISPTATTVWKFRLPELVNKVQMPAGAQVLTVAVQDGVLALWAAVCPVSATEVRTFAVVGTGHDLPDHCYRSYIGTVMTMGGRLVLHVFELNAPGTDPSAYDRVSNHITGPVNGTAMQIGTVANIKGGQ